MSRIRLRHGENEIELEGTDTFIRKHLDEFYKRVQSVPVRGQVPSLKQEIVSKISKPSSGKAPTPAEFFQLKGKKDGVSKILIFGKYLEEYRNMSQFTQKDVNGLAKEAKLSKDIHGQYYTNAVKQGLLRPHSRGKYSLTLSAESVLSAMRV